MLKTYNIKAPKEKKTGPVRIENFYRYKWTREASRPGWQRLLSFQPRDESETFHLLVRIIQVKYAYTPDGKRKYVHKTMQRKDSIPYPEYNPPAEDAREIREVMDLIDSALAVHEKVIRSGKKIFQPFELAGLPKCRVENCGQPIRELGEPFCYYHTKVMAGLCRDVA